MKNGPKEISIFPIISLITLRNYLKIVEELMMRLKMAVRYLIPIRKLARSSSFPISFAIKLGGFRIVCPALSQNLSSFFLSAKPIFHFIYMKCLCKTISGLNFGYFFSDGRPPLSTMGENLERSRKTTSAEKGQLADILFAHFLIDFTRVAARSAEASRKMAAAFQFSWKSKKIAVKLDDSLRAIGADLLF